MPKENMDGIKDATELAKASAGRPEVRPGLGVRANRYGEEGALQPNTASAEPDAPAGSPPEQDKRRAPPVRRFVPRNEDEMRLALRRALDEQRDLDARFIQVEMHDGVILLRGRVTSARMRALAEDTVDGFIGVHVIRNEIGVRASAGNLPSSAAPGGPVIPGGLEVMRGKPEPESNVEVDRRLEHRRSA